MTIYWSIQAAFAVLAGFSLYYYTKEFPRWWKNPKYRRQTLLEVSLAVLAWPAFVGYFLAAFVLYGDD